MLVIIWASTLGVGLGAAAAISRRRMQGVKVMSPERMVTHVSFRKLGV